MRAFCFWVDNPFGRCTTARVAVVAVNRKRAASRIKEHGLKFNPRRDVDRYFTEEERFLVQGHPEHIWVKDTGDAEGGWMPLDDFVSKSAR